MPDASFVIYDESSWLDTEINRSLLPRLTGFSISSDEWESLHTNRRIRGCGIPHVDTLRLPPDGPL